MDATAKQQVVERVKQASNILVTVSKNPSVDQLAACIGLTLFLNKLGKHATAVFSGQVPSTIEFLQPEKTISTNTDNLRDFIISLDKEKADKLRYKVEDNFVRIYITPYRTSLSEKDLQFSQGEVNVDLVLALGVTDQNQLDDAITAHGKILHDATVVAVNAASVKTQLGQINWQEAASSSLSEMIVSISEAFGSNLLDGQMATAFLTGIVASTDRFGNDKTSPKVMTMAAQLMAAGANQQLIINKLEPPKPKPAEAPKAVEKPAAPSKAPDKQPQIIGQKEDKGTLNVKHGKDEVSSEEVEIDNREINIDKEGNLLKAAEEAARAEAAKQALPAQQAQLTPAPADVAPAEELPPPLPAPELPEAPPTAPETPPQSPETPPETGGHHLLNTAPPTSVPFTTAAEQWAEAQEDAPDPLSDEEAPSGEIIGRAKDVEPPHEEQARNAVEQAYQAGSAPEISFNPPAEPQAQPPQEGQAAPPPFPPPITLNQGVVIPPPYTPNQNGKQDAS